MPTDTDASVLALPTPLVSSQWLADHLGADDLVVLDATVLDVATPSGGRAWLSGYDQYLIGGHIPGALFGDLLEEFSDPEARFAFTRPSEERFSAAVAALGIGGNSRVVIYDSFVGQWAARLWWVFRSLGFEQVAVLDGGLTSWKSAERPTDTGHVPAHEASPAFAAAAQPGYWVDKADIDDVLAGRTAATLVCALPSSDFRGETGARPRRGHIPGSVSIPVSRVIDHERRTVLSGDSLREQLAPALEPGLPVIVYCGAGIAASLSALTLTLDGHDDVRVYDGSLGEWSADPDAPLVSEAITV